MDGINLSLDASENTETAATPQPEIPVFDPIAAAPSIADLMQSAAPAAPVFEQATAPAAEASAPPAEPVIEVVTAPPPTAMPAAAPPAFTAVSASIAHIPDSAGLSEAELKTIKDFASKIDVRNTAQILQYGGQAQKKVSTFSEAALANVKTKDVNEIGDMLSNMVMQLRSFEIEDSGKKRLFAKSRDKMALKKAEFDTVAKNVDKITDALEGHKVTLLKDVHMLDQMYDKNLEYYKELTMYIIAGRKKLEDILANELPALQKKAIASGLQEDALEANHLADMCNRFDKKLHDLELTRVVSIQMSPQIRLVQSTNNIMVEKIHSSIVNTIPLWKNQMVLALGMANTQKAIQTQRAVTDMTNELLKKNADSLRLNTIEAAKESERAIVDIETLKHTNQSLISTLDEVLQIQNSGREKRREAQAELLKIEEELKAKLLDIRDGGGSTNPNVVVADPVVPKELTM
ncbi:MAG: toxic anion resistance protein [Oscillospiraceae bacterium]|nr:toxic anion resistance protein [Oscillospiraceae bacterium]